MSSSPMRNTIFRRCVIAAAPLVVLLLVWPAKYAYADIFSAFTDCFTTVTSLGGSTSDIDGTSIQQAQFLTNTIYPQSQIGQAQSSISTTITTYRPWMTSVMAFLRTAPPWPAPGNWSRPREGATACRRPYCNHPFRAPTARPSRPREPHLSPRP